MSTNNKLLSHTQYIDGQLVQVTGPDNTFLSYQYDQEQRLFYLREGLITAANQHGPTHIAQDPIPPATCDSPGLMASDDKCKLDALVGTRLGVLGFQGAGFPDDGGWMSGDVLLSAGSEFISLERVGNVIRFVVDIPTPHICTAEECFQVFWIQDETDVNALRPPSCGGSLPGVNAYGELKIYLFPESTIINPNSTQNTLSKKGEHPSFIFKRYDDGVGVNEGEIDLVLKRNVQDAATIGWAFTPGATGIPECVWFMGTDTSGNKLEFKLDPNQTPGLLGAILYNGNSITKKMAIITGYQSDVVATNRYKAKWWSLNDQEEKGDEFTVVNLQQWDIDNNTRVLDSSFGSVLNIGQLIDVWTVNCNGSVCYYSKEQPTINSNGLWATLGAAEFGNTIESRPEVDVDPTSTINENKDSTLFDFNEWGMTNFDDPMLVFIDGTGGETIPATGIANYTVNIINQASENSSTPDRRHLEVSDDNAGDNIQRPVFLWHRASLRNALIEVHMPKPVESYSGTIFPPIDILLRAPISTVDTKYGTIVSAGSMTTGQYSGFNYMKLAGVHWQDLPPRGAVKVIMFDGSFTYGQVVRYATKMIDDISTGVYLVSSDPIPAVGTVVEILHQEYTTPAARLQFNHNSSEHDIEMNVKVGTIDMSTDFQLGDTNPTATFDNFIQDFTNYNESATHWQDGTAETTTNGLVTSNEGFYVLEGGIASTIEYYNILRVMVIESQVWIWWNNLLLPPVSVAGTGGVQPYYEIEDVVRYGKFGLRLWPGAKIRRVVARSKIFQFSELSLGQVELS